MFLLLLISLLFVSILAAFIVHKIFGNSIRKILSRLFFNEELYEGWYKYIIFAIYIVSWTSSTKIWRLQDYIKPDSTAALTKSTFYLEIYRGLMDAFGAIIWLLFVFFLFTMIAYVITKIILKFTNKNNG